MEKRAQLVSGETASPRDGEQGYMLLGLIVVIAIILLWLGVAAADMAHTVRVERERESVRRAQQYVRAIRLFNKKSGAYPASIKALENTNMVRYLRQEYNDPLTGKPYRLIGVGQNKTTVKGFFGQPLGGIAGSGLGALAGAASPGMPGGPGNSSTTTGSNSATATTGVNGTNTINGANGTNGTASGPGGTTTSGFSNTGFGTSSFGSASGSNTIGPFMGVGSDAKGDSILTVNEQTTYETWEFLYDPRIEALYKAAAMNAGVSSGMPGSSNNSGFGPSGNTPNSNQFNNQPPNSNPLGPSTAPGSNGTPTPGNGNPPNGP
jgi:hypothetical protein